MSAVLGTVPQRHGYSERRRWLILALLFAITVVNFVDRQTLSVLAPVVRQNLHLSNEAYGRIVSAFQFGMMTGELPMGALMDRFGARIVLAGAVLWWSGATSAQAFTKSGFQLGLARLWMGTGECGNYSGGIKVLTQLFRKENRTLAIGIFNSGSMIGSTIAPPIIVWLLQRHGYRSAFLVAASLGLLWVPLWLLLYRNPPAKEEHRDTKPERSVWELFAQRSVWAVMMCRFFIGPVMQFYWYWIPNYLFHERHVSMSGIGYVAWIPFVLGDIGGVAGGWSAGALEKRGLRVYSVRRITMYLSALLCIVSLFVPFAKGLLLAYLLIGVSMLADNFLSANMFGAITDLFPESEVGRVTGFTGLAAGLSGLLFPLLTGYLVDHVSYTPVFFLIGIMPMMGAAALFLLGSPAYRQLQETR
ncbi:MFS transporter [Terriglobus sp. RCC_193]|uniref:MFS transporter n=1 Tax=Terriglobus sp. RCC_193 TaxID=3239218 RepID=UPI003523886A